MGIPLLALGGGATTQKGQNMTNAELYDPYPDAAEISALMETILAAFKGHAEEYTPNIAIAAYLEAAAFLEDKFTAKLN